MEEVPRRTSPVPLAFPCFVLRLIGVETEGVLDYQGRAGIMSIERWNLRPVIFGVENRKRPNTVSESTVSNTELNEFFGAHRVPGRELSEFLSAYYLCAKANSPSSPQNSPSLPQNSVRLSEFSPPKQYSRNSIPPVSFFVRFLSFLGQKTDKKGIFPICSGMVGGFSRFVLFLFLGLLRAPTRNSPERVRDTIWTFPEKKVGNTRVWKPPGLASLNSSCDTPLLTPLWLPLFGLGLPRIRGGVARCFAIADKHKAIDYSYTCSAIGCLARARH